MWSYSGHEFSTILFPDDSLYAGYWKQLVCTKCKLQLTYVIQRGLGGNWVVTGELGAIPMHLTATQIIGRYYPECGSLWKSIRWGMLII